MGNRSGRWAGAVAAIVIMVTCVWLGSGPAGAQPRMSVSPKLHLSKGDQITVGASGLPPGTNARIIQCDQFNDDVEQDCAPRATAIVNRRGGFATTVTLDDPLIRSQPFGDGQPVYCRADICRIFVVWSDAQGTTQVLVSQRLWFIGSPATVTATPSSNLRQNQVVDVAGTAYGAQAHVVQLVQQACFHIVQASGCYGASPAVTTRVRSDGTFARRMTVHRFLADGTDCTDPDILGSCMVNAIVLDANGQPDDTFGISRWGDPRAYLTFRS